MERLDKTSRTAFCVLGLPGASTLSAESLAHTLGFSLIEAGRRVTSVLLLGLLNGHHVQGPDPRHPGAVGHRAARSSPPSRESS